MCYAKPGPRCSSHANAALKEATESVADVKERLSKAVTENDINILNAELYEKNMRRTEALHDWNETKMGQDHLQSAIDSLKSQSSEDNDTTKKIALYTRVKEEASARREKKINDLKAQEHLKSQKYKEDAARAAKEQWESFERSDTDGFLSQHSSGLSERLSSAKAEIAENGGVHEFVALFDTKGNLVPAKLIDTKYGSAWALLSDPYDSHSDFVGFVNESRANSPEKQKAALAKKGYAIGTVRAPARADYTSPKDATGLSGLASVGIGIFRRDGGFSPDVDIVDNGIDTDNKTDVK